MAKFKIFYSWQSDLPGNKTRNFIRECIDDAISYAQESEAIDAVRDEATKDTTGSPDIVTTLFSKIDECDLFIADISLCFTGDNPIMKDGVETRKRSPNPNVIAELGYAVKTLSWDRVICLCNTDFGDDFPFDIEHNRRTPFSLEGRKKSEVRREIAQIIFSNIQELKGQPSRTKPGKANHIVGLYAFDQHNVRGEIEPLLIEDSNCFIEHNQRILHDAHRLLSEINAISDKIEKENRMRESFTKSSPISSPAISEKSDMSDQMKALRAVAESFRGTEIPVVWKSDSIIQDSKRIKKYLSVDVNEDFFNLYNLKQINNPLNGTVLVGSDNEKAKYDNLYNLSYLLCQLELRLMYIETFKGLLFIPLAIQNISEIQDEAIRIVVNVESGKIIEPDKNLIYNELQGIQGLLCKDDEDENDIGVIAELFILPEDDRIQTEMPPFSPSASMPKIPVITGYGLSYPEKTEEDYENELRDYIASTDGRGYYEFNVKQLRPNECRWLSTGMLIKPEKDNVVISYHIYSSHSSGELCGRLIFQPKGKDDIEQHKISKR